MRQFSDRMNWALKAITGASSFRSVVVYADSETDNVKLNNDNAIHADVDVVHAILLCAGQYSCYSRKDDDRTSSLQLRCGIQLADFYSSHPHTIAWVPWVLWLKI
jgi:hypothetical protein